MEYGVTTKNKFAFLSGDEEVTDPNDIATIAEGLARSELTATSRTKKSAIRSNDGSAAIKAAPLTVEKKSQSGVGRENKENTDSGHPPNRNQQDRARGPGQRNERQQKPRGDELRDVIGDRFGEKKAPPSHRPAQPRRDGHEQHGHDNSDTRSNRPMRGGGPRVFNRGGGVGQQGFRRPRDEKPQHGEGVEDSEGKDKGAAREARDGGGGGRPNFNRRPQQYAGNRMGRSDRVSGSDKTGVKAVEKKDGAGKGNWGTNADELAGETEPTHVSEEEGKKSGQGGPDQEKTGGPVEANGDGKPAGEESKEEEKARLTLEEWKAQHKEAQPNFNVRKAGEGNEAMGRLYQNFVPMKTETAQQLAPEDKDNAAKMKQPQGSKGAKQHVQIELNFSKGQKNTDANWGRGGPRGDRPGFRPDGDRREGGGRGGGAGGGGGGGGPGRYGGHEYRGGAPSGSRGDGGRRFNNNPHERNQRPTGSSSGGGAENSASFNLNAESFPALGAQ